MISDMFRIVTLVIGLLGLAVGCSRRMLAIVDASAEAAPETAPMSDAAPDSDAGGCQAMVDVTGISPEGPFSGSGVHSEVAINMPPDCHPGVRLRISDETTGSSFIFELAADSTDGGPFLSDARSVPVEFDGAARAWMTTATIEVISADPLPLTMCEKAPGPIALAVSDSITLMIGLSQDGFAITGRVSVRYCYCKFCPDSA